MTWRNQIQSSKYIKGVATCTGLQNTDVPTLAVCSNGDGTYSFGGSGKETTLATGSSQRVRSVYSGAAGSAAEVYSSDKILLQKAGRQYCAELITDQDAYTVFPKCTTVNTNGPTSDNPNPAVNNQDSNSYLPPFDTYYKFKNPPAPVIDQNKKHYVQYCDGCVVEPVVTRYGWPLLMVGTPSSMVIANSVVYYGMSVFVAGTFNGTIKVYDGNPTHTITQHPTITMTSADPLKLDAFLIQYEQSGKIVWFTTIKTVSGTQTTAYQLAVDASGIYVSGYMDGTINIYQGAERTSNQGSVVATRTPTNAALFVLKYTLVGNFDWAAMVDGIQNQSSPSGNEIQPTNMSQICTDGRNVYVGNSIDSGVAQVTVYNANESIALTMTNGGAGNSQQGFLVQYNALTGTTKWATRLTGSLTGPSYPGSSSVTGILCDTNNVYMSGYYNNTANAYHAITPANQTFGASQATITNGSNNGMYIAAFNNTGSFLWINSGNIASSSFISNGVQLTMDATGVYVVVPFPSAITFNTTPRNRGSPPAAFTLQMTGAGSSYNIGIVKYDLTGSLTWATKILDVDNGGGTIINNGFSLSSDGSGLYVTGGFGASSIRIYDSSTSADPSSLAMTLPTAGGTNTNVFLNKYNLLGVLQWSTKIGTSGSYAFGYSVSSNTTLIYVTGTANGDIDLYNANGRIPPTSIGASLTPGAGTYFYTYVAEFSNSGEVLLS